MRTSLQILLLWSLLALAGTARAAASLDALRVYSVQPDTFELKFMSTMGTGTNTKLALNHVDGTTHIVTVGDRIGDYTVAAYEPTVERIFNPSINAHQEKKSGKVTLSKANEDNVILKMGKPLAADGWTACIVATNTGAWGFAAPGDRIMIDNHTAEITEISPERTALRTGNQSRDIAWATDNERAAVQSLWEEQRRQDEVDAALQEQRVAERQEEDVLPIREPLRIQDKQPAFSPQSRLRSSSQSFGVEYSYPIEYEVIPVWVRLPNGRTSLKPIALPTRFARRKTGITSFSVTPRY
jgi:hypothetical protein